MPDVKYLIGCTVSSLGGFVVGLTVRVIVDCVTQMGRWMRRLPHKSAAIGSIVVIVGAISTTMLFLQGRQLDRQAQELAVQREYSIRVTNCQTLANQAFRDALDARSTASAGQTGAQIVQIRQQIAQNEGQDRLLSISATNIAGAPPTAIQDYLTVLRRNTNALELVARKLEEAQRARAQNPYPSLNCGAP